MGTSPPSHLFLLLLAGLIFVGVDCAARADAPRVIRLTFRNNSGPSVSLPDRILPRTAAAAPGNIPMVYCRDATYPSDVYCDIGMLMEDDAFLDDLKVIGANAAMADPVRAGRVCTLEFNTEDENVTDPIRFEEIECGRVREIPAEGFPDLPDGIDSAAFLPQFSVAKMTDVVVTSYASVFGCRYRLKRQGGRVGATKTRPRGHFFKLDSFFCTAGFGLAEGRPPTRYPPQMYYKHDGKRWRPVDIWPDYV